jgi:penicillin-binding protein 1C
MALAVLALGFVAFRVAVALWPYPRGLDQLPRDSTMLCDDSGAALAEFAAPDGQWRTTLSEDQISPHLLRAIVAVEDGRFYKHGGVDWRAVAAAAWQDLTALRAKRGGSTITMQLQRLRQPAARSFAGKVSQAVRAAQIERTTGKRQILVEYLNRAPFGGNLVGAGAASWRYFGRPCRELSLAQAAMLAGLPKNPTADRPDRFPARAKARRDFVLGRMLAEGMISAGERDAAVAEPIDAAWRPLPQRASPAVQAALPTLSRVAGQSGGGRVQVTLDPGTQQLAATAAREYLDQQADHISEIAVVVVDIASAKGLASVSLSRSGVVDLDLTDRPRSTGSVIKPLIYAAAFDAGISSPEALVDDSPAAWSGYAPANYDTEFRGRMTAAAALAESRNIPALRLLSQVGVRRAAGVCGAVGLETMSRTPQRYGLSMAVGGAEATCAEVAGAYATLARDGVRRPVTWLAPGEHGDDAARPTSLSARACRATLACLSDARRPTPVCPEAAALEVAWKTGTSSGHRDAWCAAVGPARVVVVWMGNASGEGSRSLVGGEAAAPLALRLLAAIDGRVQVVPRTLPPSSSPQRLAVNTGDGISILSPSDRSEIIRDPETKAAQQRVLLRARMSEGSSTAEPLFWFIDGLPVGTAKPADPVWWQPIAGEHEVRVADAAGRSARATIRVR